MFHRYDSTVGIGWTPVTVSGLSDYYDSTSADFVSERPFGYLLSNFSRETFTGAGAGSLRPRP